MGPGGSDPAVPTHDPVLSWLLEETQPSVRCSALVELLGRREDDADVRRARARIPTTGWARELLRRQKPEGFWEARAPTDFEGQARFLQFPQFRSTMWPLQVLSDLGLTAKEARIRKAAELLFDYKLRFSSPFNFFTEEVCAVGNVARMLTRFGYADDRRVRKLHAWMLEDQREDGGWNCAPDQPGTLDCWEALAAFAELPRSARGRSIESAIERGCEFYLERHLFREGKRYDPWFRFHYPTHYFYDVLVGLDVLTRLGYAGDRRLGPALKLLTEKRRPDGTWILDRVHPDVGRSLRKDYRGTEIHGWSLEPPGKPSKWITLTARAVLARVDRAN